MLQCRGPWLATNMRMAGDTVIAHQVIRRNIDNSVKDSKHE
jgi:hypothetical protein